MHYAPIKVSNCCYFKVYNTHLEITGVDGLNDTHNHWEMESKYIKISQRFHT